MNYEGYKSKKKKQKKKKKKIKVLIELVLKWRIEALLRRQ